MTEEQQGQIEWLEDLKETIESGNIEVAIESIDGAIKLLEREQKLER